MSRKEVPRAGLIKTALAGHITNAQGAAALGLPSVVGRSGAAALLDFGWVWFDSERRRRSPGWRPRKTRPQAGTF